MKVFEHDYDEETEDFADYILHKLEKAGMMPPGVQVKKVRPTNMRWGTMCSMRCVCASCYLEFIVHEWEPEND